MTPDPVVVTTETPVGPTAIECNAYVRNNLLRFIDPTGKILTVSGDVNAAKQDLCIIADNTCYQIAVDQRRKESNLQPVDQEPIVRGGC